MKSIQQQHGKLKKLKLKKKGEYILSQKEEEKKAYPSDADSASDSESHIYAAAATVKTQEIRWICRERKRKVFVEAKMRENATVILEKYGSKKYMKRN